MPSGNGQPPEGYQSPVRQALARRHTVAGVPRTIGGAVMMFCVGLGVLLDSWGAIGVFGLLFVIMRRLTKRDPWWPEVWRDYLLLWMQLHPFEATLLKTGFWVSIAAVILAVLFL